MNDRPSISLNVILIFELFVTSSGAAKKSLAVVVSGDDVPMHIPVIRQKDLALKEQPRDNLENWTMC